jgi:monoamine oxidase
VHNRHGDSIRTVAIVGGGPGGLMTAYLLQKKSDLPLRVTLYESSGRCGGKVMTPRFDAAPVQYEAGAAEFYDYSVCGPSGGSGSADDALKELIAELGLAISPMGGQSIVMGERWLANLDDVEAHFGPRVRRSLETFHGKARDRMSPWEFYCSGGMESPPVHRPERRFETYLRQTISGTQRSIVENMIHSDLATEPSATSVEYGLQNYLMNDPAYMRLYAIDGGNEQLIHRLRERVAAAFRLNEPVSQIVPGSGGRLRVRSKRGGEPHEGEYDFVIVAVPHDGLGRIEFGGARLASALDAHRQRYDHPAHYLRITALFRRPFWRGTMVDSYCMLDRFGGCCLYDESSRSIEPNWGVLGWLLAGEQARQGALVPDEVLISQALDSLPRRLGNARKWFLEGRVHRWIGAVNAIPGGVSPLGLDRRHQIDPVVHPRLFVVGDYLFDATLNGVLDSADYVSDWVVADLHQSLAD